MSYVCEGSCGSATELGVGEIVACFYYLGAVISFRGGV